MPRIHLNNAERELRDKRIEQGLGAGILGLAITPIHIVG